MQQLANRQSVQPQNDFEQVCSDQKVIQSFEPGEQVLFSLNIIKYTGGNQPLPRIFVITNKNLYNLAPPEENSVVQFFQSLVNKSRIKRKISFQQISQITISLLSKEFILHVPSEYDQRYQADKQFQYQFSISFSIALIVELICEYYIKNNFKKPLVSIIEESDLIQYTTTTYDLKKKFRRPLPPAKMLDAAEIKEMLKHPKIRSQTLYMKRATPQQTTQAEIGFEDFKLIKVIGRGAFGKVMLCEKNDTKEIFAIKQLRKEDIIARDQVEYLKTERKILEQINHPFLVSLEFAFQTDENIFFVMKFMRGGELFTHLKKINRFSEQITLFYSSQVLLALEHLHQLNIVYRDLKPENILMDKDGYVALTDYGLAKFISKGQATTSIVGTPEYLAPEVIQQIGHTFTADWWCLGILIYEMLCGKTPFYSENRGAMFKFIVENEVKFPSNVYLSNDCKSLINALLNKKPNQRLGSKSDGEEIKKHPWFKQIDFTKLINREIKAPIIPEGDELDLQNFNPDLLNEEIEEFQGEKNEEAIKQFDKEIYGLNYAPKQN